MNIDYADMFRTLHPDFFASEAIRSLPREYVFEEQVLDLHRFSVGQLEISCPEHIVFGLYAGDIDALREAVRQVDADWPQYFHEGDRIYCAFEDDQVVSFCLLDDLGQYGGLRVGGPGCVGTLPEYRKQGIGLRLVQNATAILKADGFDLSYIHYTHVGHWYARLGYQTVVRWNARGIVE